MELAANDITLLIPQRAPFVMISQLVYFDAIITRTNFIIKKDNVLLDDDHFSAAGLVENIAQTAAARAGYIAGIEKKSVQVGYIGAVKNLVINQLPSINDELITEVSVLNQIFEVTIISGKVKCNNILLASCEMKIFIQN